MKRKIVLLSAIFMTVGLVGCGKEDIVNEAQSQLHEENDDEIENMGEGIAVDEADKFEAVSELTFEDLSKYNYQFASGAGGWSTDLNIEKDGYFWGTYHDSDMGATGEGYEYGEYYYCEFKGHFENLTKIDNLTYEMTLSDISYANEVDTQEIKNKTLYKYSDAYGLVGTDTFRVYLPGTKYDDLGEEITSWVAMAMDKETDVTSNLIIVNVDQQYGIYTYERALPKEEAENTYNWYKDDYDAYSEMLSTGDLSQAEMNDIAKLMFEETDDCLNRIWNLFKYNSDEETFNSILEEQRKWNKSKEEQATAEKDSWDGGSLGPTAYYDTLADLTIKRCEELLQYIN